MDKDILDKDLGKVGQLSLKLEAGKLHLSLESNPNPAVNASVEVLVDPDYFIDMLAAVIPGTIDDTIFAILKSALKA